MLLKYIAFYVMLAAFSVIAIKHYSPDTFYYKLGSLMGYIMEFPLIKLGKLLNWDLTGITTYKFLLYNALIYAFSTFILRFICSLKIRLEFIENIDARIKSKKTRVFIKKTFFWKIYATQKEQHVGYQELTEN